MLIYQGRVHCPPLLFVVIPMKYKELIIEISIKGIPRFSILLQQGFKVMAKTGVSVKELLCQQMGIKESYFDTHIQTIFIDGMPVDKPEETPVLDGSIISLSGPMPGLAGATLRRGSYYAPMRQSITVRPSDRVTVEEQGTVTIKLFNMPLSELGPEFLKKGIFIDGQAILNLIENNSPSLQNNIHKIILNKRSVSLEDLKKDLKNKDNVFFKIITI